MQSSAYQLPLEISGVDEALMFHNPERYGSFSLLVKVNDKMKQRSYPLSEMPKVLSSIDKELDTYISMGEFSKYSRKTEHLLRIGVLYVDIDTYYFEFSKGRTPKQLADSVLFHCDDVGIPRPTTLVFSGRGIQAKWLLKTPVPHKALYRWKACQEQLIKKLEKIGADTAAKDASRVLRVVGTKNTKSGEYCSVVHVESDKSGEPVRYCFDELAHNLLPVEREVYERKRADKQRKKDNLKAIQGGFKKGLKKPGGNRLALDRFGDLKKLLEIRWGGKTVERGERMKFLFWQLNFLLLAGATTPQHLKSKAKSLAEDIDPNWRFNPAALETLATKGMKYLKRERVTFNGKDYLPLYTPHNETLINTFKITEEEQKQLKTIISKELSAERHRVRETTRRRTSGAIPREVYEQNAADKKKRAVLLRSQGLTIRAIAEKMNVSPSSVSNYLKDSIEVVTSERLAHQNKRPKPPLKETPIIKLLDECQNVSPSPLKLIENTKSTHVQSACVLLMAKPFSFYLTALDLYLFSRSNELDAPLVMRCMDVLDCSYFRGKKMNIT